MFGTLGRLGGAWAGDVQSEMLLIFAAIAAPIVKCLGKSWLFPRLNIDAGVSRQYISAAQL